MAIYLILERCQMPSRLLFTKNKPPQAIIFILREETLVDPILLLSTIC
jgi:hypothetical protein